MTASIAATVSASLDGRSHRRYRGNTPVRSLPVSTLYFNRAMSRPQWLTFGGFAVLAVVVVWQFKRINDMQETNVALRDQISEAASRLEAGRPPGERLVISTAASDARPETAGPGPGETAKSGREARFRQMREMDRKQHQDAKILALTTKLNLTAEQQVVIRAALEKSSIQRDALRDAGESRRRAGIRDTEEKRREDMMHFGAIDVALEETIAASLSAEQLAAYSEYQTEQKLATIENRANQQLGDLLTRFSLSEDQKDAAFQFFAKQEEESGFEPARIAALGGDFMLLFEQRQKDKLEALKQILTPEQYALYSAQEEQRSATFRNMVPGGQPGGAVPPPPPRSP